MEYGSEEVNSTRACLEVLYNEQEESQTISEKRERRARRHRWYVAGWQRTTVSRSVNRAHKTCIQLDQWIQERSRDDGTSVECKCILLVCSRTSRVVKIPGCCYRCDAPWLSS